MLHKGYKTKDIVGRKVAQYWKDQLKINDNMISVLKENKLHEEVEDMLQNQSSNKAKKTNQMGKSIENGSDYSGSRGSRNGSRAGSRRGSNVGSNNSEDDFDDLDVVDDIPAVIRPIPPIIHDLKTSSIRPLTQLMQEVVREDEIQQQNFQNKEQMMKYENQDYKVKAFLMLVTAGRKKKMWMPGKTIFDKRGGKYSDKVAGLG